jgi:hypothetical protein
LKTQPIPKDADMMTVKEFIDACACNALTDDDGCGYFCLNGATMTDVPAVPSKVYNKTEADFLGWGGVAWFNK